ncbi:ABC transporter substrate-binding protein [Haloparvum sp. PAK95]|uniref:ABC transporter substrate-binding protein n=1 Tax=Haloparvum sp. PAK95 TaxID=3418962 RepID=UPI003D2F0849
MTGSSQVDTNSESGAGTTQSTSNRRAFLGAVGTASATALAGCSSIMGGDGGPPTLRVTAWSGNYGERFEKAIRPIFEERFDAELQINFGWSEILSKIKSAPKDDPPFDVTITAEPLYFNGRNQNLFEEIRYEENVPNYEEVMPFFKDVRPPKYGAPVDGAPLATLYRDDLAEPVDEWTDFTSEFVQNSNGVGVDSGFWIFPLMAAAVGTDAAPGAGELYNEDQHEAVIDTLEEWPIEGWAASGTDIWQQFDDETIDAAQWYVDQVWYDVDSHEGISMGVPENNPGYLDNWAVVRGTDNRQLGEEFINMLLDAEVQSKWSEESALFFTNKNTEYAGDLGDVMPTNNEEASKLTLPQWDELADHASKFSDQFKEMKTQG